MTPRTPFTVIPWEGGFLPPLLELALEETGGNIGRASFLFPHNRPIRYFTLLLRRHGAVQKPLLLPRMYSISSLFSLLAGRIAARPAWNAGLLDRVGLLLQCVREQAGRKAGPGDALLPGDPKRFFPWGVRLASLFEECFSQCKRPHDFIHLEGQVSPYARALLERLGGIFARYEAGLAERGWTTPGHEAFAAASYVEATDELPPGAPSPDGPLYIAGFHALTGAEDRLFRHLWTRGARIVLHADPGTADGRGHWSCQALADRARAWGARMDVFPSGAPHDGGAPAIRYVAGYDLHSQLAALREELDGTPGAPPLLSADVPVLPTEQTERPDDSQGLSLSAEDRLADTAIILPDSGLLLPVLHHLPRADVNISMGYPLARSPLFRLADTLLRLQERRKGAAYYWRDLVELLRHPYIKMLREAPSQPESQPDNQPGAPPGEAAYAPDSGREGPENLRRELHALERALRQRGGKFIEPRTFLMDEYQQREAGDLPQAPVLAFLEKLLAICLDAFRSPGTPAEIAACLEDLCGLLLEHGERLWPHFPIDAECLYRMRHTLIPELAHSALANEPLERETLYALLRCLMEAERVPFEADPLVGMQVMGMLESRLLSFRRVIVADAVESSLPGSPQGDPLLPEALRPELGLPTPRNREQVAAYHFFRLVRSAREVVLLWRESAAGGTRSGESKSRFIEELLWEEEKRRGFLFATDRDDPPLHPIPALVSPIVREKRALAVTPAIRRLLLATLARPVSASLLDAYLACPLRFFYERAARLAPAEEVREGDDPLAVGDMMHLLLHDVYTPLLGRALPGGEELESMLGEELAASFAASPELARLGRTLPADSFAMLVAAGKKRLADYLLAQPETTPLALEAPLSADFFARGVAGSGLSVKLTGKADRIDARRGAPCPDEAEPQPYRVILDYKTGHVPHIPPGVWDREHLWDALDQWTPDAAQPAPPGVDCDPALSALRESLESVQLPFYLLLHHLASERGDFPARGEAALDARWVALGDRGHETPLFPDAMPHEKRREIITDKFPRLLRFLLRHMAESPILAPSPGVRCNWCSCAKICTVHAASTVLSRT